MAPTGATAEAKSDPWRQVVGNGFGDVRNRGVDELHVFKGQLYAGTDRTPRTGPAQLWRSPSGQPQSWARVIEFQPPLPSTTEGIETMGSTALGGGFLYLGTKDSSASRGPAVYRSADGGPWELFNGDGSGWTRDGNSIISSLAVFDGNLYVATANRRGAQLWRTPYERAAFEKVLDFAAIDANLDRIASIWPFKGQLYVGTHYRGRRGGQLWVSSAGNPGSWRRVKQASNGFGNPDNRTVGSALVEFEGRLYASTLNAARGGELWSSTDGRKWKLEAPAGLDNPYNREFHSLNVAFGQLWIAARTVSPGSAQVWRAQQAAAFGIPDQGIAFSQSNQDGFGIPATRGGSPVTSGFGNSVFWAGENRSTGAQVWQLDMDELRRSEAVGPGVKISEEPVRLTRGGVIRVRVSCPADDPGGCHGDLVLRSVRRFPMRGKLVRLELGSRIFEMDAGRTTTFGFRLTRRLHRVVRRLGKLRVRAQSVALDNAENSVAVFLLLA